MSKLLITEAQLGVIVDYISTNEKPVLEEGWKDVVLGVAMLLGLVGGTQAQKAGRALENAGTVKQIKQTLDNPDGIGKLASTYNMSSDELKTLMQKNADKVDKALNTKSKYFGKSEKTASGEDAEDLIKKGYAVTDVNVDYDTITNKTPLPSDSIVTVRDTITINITPEEGFKTFESDISNDKIQEIGDVFGEIYDNNGRVINVMVMAGTDKERVPSLDNNDGTNGNSALATKRVMSGIKGVKAAGYEGKIDYDNTNYINKGETSMEEFMEAGAKAKRGDSTSIVSLRNEESDHRFLVVRVISEFDVEVEPNETVPQVIQRFEEKITVSLVKMSAYDNIGGSGSSRKTPKHKSSCKSVKIKGSDAGCPSSKF